MHLFSFLTLLLSLLLVGPPSLAETDCLKSDDPTRFSTLELSEEDITPLFSIGKVHYKDGAMEIFIDGNLALLQQAIDNGEIEAQHSIHTTPETGSTIPVSLAFVKKIKCQKQNAQDPERCLSLAYNEPPPTDCAPEEVVYLLRAEVSLGKPCNDPEDAPCDDLAILHDPNSMWLIEEAP